MVALHAFVVCVAGCSAGRVRLARTLLTVVGPARPPAGVVRDVRIYFVSLARVIGDFAAERTCLAGLLVGFLAKACGVDLCLLGISPGPGSLGLTLTRVKFFVFRFPADFRCFLAVLLLAFLLDRFPAPPAHQQDDNQQHHNDGNDYPNPWSCFHATHHFPLQLRPGRPSPSG